jgi:hypothetical protein
VTLRHCQYHFSHISLTKMAWLADRLRNSNPQKQRAANRSQRRIRSRRWTLSHRQTKHRSSRKMSLAIVASEAQAKVPVLNHGGLWWSIAFRTIRPGIIGRSAGAEEDWIDFRSFSVKCLDFLARIVAARLCNTCSIGL